MNANDLESYVVGACFWPEAIAEVVQSVSVDDFSIERYRSVFSAIGRIFSKEIQVDSFSVKQETNLTASELIELSETCPTVANIGYYIGELKTRSRKLKLLRMADEIKQRRGEDYETLLPIVESALQDNASSGAKHISHAMGKAFKKMEHAYMNKGVVTGLPTGIEKIDKELSGFHKTDFILIAARPSMGKTAIALQIADEVCQKTPVLFLTMEMADDQLASRLALSASKVNVSKARNGLFEEHEFMKMQKMAERFHKSSLFVDDCAGADMQTISAKIKAEKQRNKIGMVIVDYLGLIAGREKEYDRVTAASKEFKILAKKLNIPIVCLHQLNRSNLNNRPTMNELRSSGQLEQDADVIILLHRQKEEDVEKCELIIEKNRHGRTGIINATWNGPINRIEHAHYEHQ